jgi:hypothetical protein
MMHPDLLKTEKRLLSSVETIQDKLDHCRFVEAMANDGTGASREGQQVINNTRSQLTVDMENTLKSLAHIERMRAAEAQQKAAAAQIQAANNLADLVSMLSQRAGPSLEAPLHPQERKAIEGNGAVFTATKPATIKHD